jgi:hypothetical protein
MPEERSFVISSLLVFSSNPYSNQSENVLILDIYGLLGGVAM